MTIQVTANVADPGFFVAPTSLGFAHKILGATTPDTLRLTFRRPAVNGVAQPPVSWTATAITVTTAQVEQAAAEGNLEVTPEGVRINGVLIPGVDWLNLSTDRGTTPTVVTASINAAAAEASGRASNRAADYHP